CLRLCRLSMNSQRVSVGRVQLCYIGIFVPCACGCPIVSAPLLKSYFSSI
uniref:Uncharacterized protein n=1 Tax=Macaca fascicularis TaxID=9541 RepID=A0A7N9CI97_MACFA